MLCAPADRKGVGGCGCWESGAAALALCPPTSSLSLLLAPSTEFSGHLLGMALKAEAGFLELTFIDEGGGIVEGDGPTFRSTSSHWVCAFKQVIGSWSLSFPICRGEYRLPRELA